MSPQINGSPVRWYVFHFFLSLLATVMAWACSTDGDGVYSGSYMIPGPAEEGYDADLALLARRYDRQYHLFNAAPTGVNVEARLSLDRAADRRLLERFLSEDDGWDFAAFSGGGDPAELPDYFFKVAGLYAGAGIAADAMRYAVLRDQHAATSEVNIARTQLLRALDGMHIAFDITGVPGVVARGFARTDVPGLGATTDVLPLKDPATGEPLPAEKDNGQWRADNTADGRYPNYIWEDSCSRDMLLGWALASAVAQEVIRYDRKIPQSYRDQVAEDARGVLHNLMEVRNEEGYDLELLDADGRTTYHGYLNEHAVERAYYVPTFKNGFYAMMALGIVAGFAYASNDADGTSYLYDQLIATRKLDDIARNNMLYINMEKDSNYSNYNMAFISAFLALRYIDDDMARKKIAQSTQVTLYDTPGKGYQPRGATMALFDYITMYAFILGELETPLYGALYQEAAADALASLKGFPTPPYWDLSVEQCDDAELTSGVCTYDDGTESAVFNEGGRKGSTVCEKSIPKAIRRPSNFEWRSNPYEPNGGGDGSTLLSGVDFRAAYWMGRFIKLPQ